MRLVSLTCLEVKLTRIPSVHQAALVHLLLHSSSFSSSIESQAHRITAHPIFVISLLETMFFLQVPGVSHCHYCRFSQLLGLCFPIFAIPPMAIHALAFCCLVVLHLLAILLWGISFLRSFNCLQYLCGMFHCKLLGPETCPVPSAVVNEKLLSS